MRVIYTVLFLHLLPIMILRLFWRARKAPAYRQRMYERFANIPARKNDQPLIWVHAVSVGESIAATPMIKALQNKYPAYAFCITTTTPTGSDRVLSAFPESYHYYLPYDLPSLMTRFIHKIRPQLLIIMETELWPNLLAVCEEKNIPCILANGRLSERSAKGYGRFSSLTRPMLSSMSMIAAQAEDDAKRFTALGARQVENTGSIKFDIALTQQQQHRLQQLQQALSISNRKVAIFASTHAGEDERIMPMIERLYQQDADFLAFVVPRHPERFDNVYALAKKHDLSVQRVSENQMITAQTHVLLGDTMGDLLSFYGLADIAFIGGSLIDHGGHNFLEAALWALPTVTGPAVFNFQAIADNLILNEALDMVQDEQGLLALLSEWLSAPQPYAEKGQRALTLLKENQGALAKLLSLIDQQLVHAINED